MSRLRTRAGETECGNHGGESQGTGIGGVDAGLVLIDHATDLASGTDEVFAQGWYNRWVFVWKNK